MLRCTRALIITWLLAGMLPARADVPGTGPQYRSTDRLVCAPVFHWFTASGGQRSGPWRPLEGRDAWTGTPPFWIRQIKDIMDANIDVMYVHLMPSGEQERIYLFRALSQLREAGYDVPVTAPFLDPLITWNILPPIDCATAAGKDAFVEQYIRFFNQYFSQNSDPAAESYLFHLDGRVVLNTWHCNPGFVNNVDSLTRSDVESRLIAPLGGSYPSFNNGIYMIATPNGVAPPFADEKTHQFSGPPYYVKHIYNWRKTAGMKPGYWDQNIRNPGSFHPRSGGTHYAQAWDLLNSVRFGGPGVDGESFALPIYHVTIESWNEYDEGSGLYAADPGPPYIAPGNQSGNTDVWSHANNPREYIDTTAAAARVFSDKPLHAARVLDYEFPAFAFRGETVQASITVRNQGTMEWSHAQGFMLGQARVLHEWTFDQGPEGWTLTRNAFDTTGNEAYENGVWGSLYGASGGGLRARTGNVDNTTYTGEASTAWTRVFHLDAPRMVAISFQWRLFFPQAFESNEFGQARVRLDGQYYGRDRGNHLVHYFGGVGHDQDTGWREHNLLVMLAAGNHTLQIGSWNNRKSASEEFVDVFVDNVSILDVSSLLLAGPARVFIDDTGDEIPTYGGIFRGRPKRFDFLLTAPDAPGVYPLSFRMLRERIAWFGERLDLTLDVVIPGDADRDEDVDLSDFGHFQRCFSGSGQSYPTGCGEMDLNRDGAIDAADVSIFLDCLAGAGRPSGC